MDFADILKEWEEGQKKRGPRKLSETARSAGQKTQSGRPKAQSGRPKAQSSRCGDSARNESSGQRTCGGNEVRVNPMDFWLRRYGVFDKDKDFERAENKRKYTSAAELKNLPVEAQIDLHGLTREEAWSRLDAFISECSSRRLKKVLIVHGKGNHSEEEPVLKNLVRSFIERDKRLGTSGHPCGVDGGSGATWVIIRANLSLL